MTRVRGWPLRGIRRTGKNEFFGEFLVNAQGEDVVAGIRTPQPVAELKKWNAKVYDQLIKIKNQLEKHYRDVQDIEFTIERGKLYMLQTRTGKRTGAAAVNIACEMVKEKLINEKTALLRIPANDLTQLLLPSFSACGQDQGTGAGERAARLPGCRRRQTGLHRSRSSAADKGWRASAVGTEGNQPRRHRWHAQCRRAS